MARRRTVPAVTIRHPRASDEKRFLQLVQASRAQHRPWTDAPSTPGAFRAFVDAADTEYRQGFLICRREDGDIAGVAVISVITRGPLQSAYLGYYGFTPLAGHGYVSAGVSRVVRHAFRELKLHRLEANVQPGNTRSIALLKRCGFCKEGFSRRYLKIGGRWRDHERWAILAD